MKKINKNWGFSLSEVLVVLAIIGILAGVVLINYPLVRKRLALQRAATKLAQDIRRAQEMAISSQECCGGTVPKTGYGVYIDIDISGGGNNKQYRLYADTDGGNEFYTSVDTTLEPIIDIENGIFINQIVGSASNKLSINFKSPDPEVKIKWEVGGAPADETTIILCINGPNCTGSDIKTVYVNRAGLITVY